MKFSAVILAGGKSSRMGRDKAFLEVDGRPILARQIQLVRDVGADEVFISGRGNTNYAPFNCPVLRDRFTDTGPLAGIEAALNATSSPLLLVLAVDMPHMSADLLRQLGTHCTETVGAIPRVNGAVEPLAAFYPKASLSLATQLLDAPALVVPALAGPPTRTTIPDRLKPGLQTVNERPAKSPSAKQFAECCVAAGLATFVDLPESDAHCFTNWNSPADVANIGATT